MRQIELGEYLITVVEDSYLANEAGAVLWDAGLVLIHFLIKGPWIAGKRVIELGSGTGAVGLVAAGRGAASVTLTDLPHLLPLLTRNVAANPELTGACAVHVAELDWGQSDLSSFDPPFDVVLASDVLYQAAALQPFLRTLRTLCNPQTLVLLANEHRPALPFPGASFEAAGFAVERVPTSDLDQHWCSEDIHVYRIRLHP